MKSHTIATKGIDSIAASFLAPSSRFTPLHAVVEDSPPALIPIASGSPV